MQIDFKQAEMIAKAHLRIETLTPRNRDSLDFHDVGVRSLYEALNEAYLLGMVTAIERLTKDDSQKKKLASRP